MLILFCSSFLSFLVLQSSPWGRESLVLWCVLNFVSPVFCSCHGLVCRMWSWHLGHIHLPFGFPGVSQAKYFCELDIHLYDEQEHRSI